MTTDPIDKLAMDCVEGRVKCNQIAIDGHIIVNFMLDATERAEQVRPVPQDQIEQIARAFGVPRRILGKFGA